MKVLICGSRGWHDPLPIDALIAGYDLLADGANEELEIIHGDARSGADAMADKIGRRWGAKITRCPADWDTHGKSAGFIRNSEMLKLQPDVVWAFRAEGKSNGTDDMVWKARDAGIPTYVVTGDAHE
jgi:hypothetical protein